MKYLKINEIYEDKYNEYYYLVMNIPSDRLLGDNNNRVIDGLKNRKFIGLKSISDNIGIINGFFDIRNLAIIMPKVSTDIINKLEKIEYFDVNYLCNNDMEVLRRMYNVDSDYDNASLFSQISTRGSYWQYKTPKIQNDKTLNDFIKIRNFAFNNYKQYKIIQDSQHQILRGKKVKNFNHLVYIFYKFFKNTDNDTLFRNLPYRSDKNLELELLTVECITNILKYLILSFSVCFSTEGEVLIKDNFFNIPDGSTLIVKYKDNIKYFMDDEDIKNKYDIKYIKTTSVYGKTEVNLAKTIIRNL